MATYSPGLQLMPRTVTLNVNVAFGPCVSTNPAINSATAGTPPGGVPARLGCLNLLDSASGQASFTGTTRHQPEHVQPELPNGARPTRHDGDRHGHRRPVPRRSVTTVAVSPAPNFLDCLSPGGLTQRSAVVTLTIVSSADREATGRLR